MRFIFKKSNFLKQHLLVQSALIVLSLQLNLTIRSQEIGFSGLVNPYQREKLSTYVFRSWGQAEGLPPNGVHAIAQTSDGFLWLGTSTGLVRFDGTDFKVFSPYTTPEIPAGTIKALFVDTKERLWIGSLDGGIVMMQDRIISEIDTSKVNAYGIMHFTEDLEGRIWAGTDGGIFKIEGERLLRDPMKKGPSGRSNTVAVDSDTGGIYTCYWEIPGLWGMDKFLPIHVANTTNPLSSQSIYPRKEGGLWFLSSSIQEYGALTRLLEPQVVTLPQKWPFEIPQYGIGAFLEDRQKNLWISLLGEGIYRVGKDGEYEMFSVGKGNVVSLFEDQNGSIWAGSSISGLTRIKKGLFQNFTASGSGTVGTVSAEPSGDIIFSEAKGAYRIQNDKLMPIELGWLTAVYADRSGNFWAATPGSLGQYKWEGLAVASSPNFVNTDQPAKQIRCFFESKNGQMWFGSLFGGILTSKGKSIQVLSDTQRDAIYSLTEDKYGKLWAGTQSGDLWVIDDSKSIRMEISSETDHRPIASIFFDTEGILLLGTMGKGLIVRKGEQYIATRQEDGLPSDEVVGIIEVGPHLWLATTGGIARINRNELVNRTTTSGPLSQCLVFGSDDGLLDYACSSLYSPNMYLAEDGQLYISMKENLVSFNPEEISKTAKTPQIHIEELRVDDVNIQSYNDLYVIPPGPGRLTFTFTAVNLEAPERTRFQYKLVGLDSDWINSWSQRTASYNSPPYGTYEFHVRASNSLGEWDDHTASLQLTIEPHFWQTLPFKVVTFAFVGIIFGAIIWLAARVKLSRRLIGLERDHAVQKERARIASEIHDQLGAQLTQILFLSQSLTGRLENDEDHQAAEQACKVTSSAQELAQGLDEVVWATNPEMDDYEGLVAYISSYAEEFFRQTSIRLRFDVPISFDNREMVSEVRHNLFLAASEAMTNILKHANASEATIKIQSTGKEFIIEISDDGVGLTQESSQRRRNGLQNISKRLQTIGGSTAFIQRKPKGLTVRLSVHTPPTSISASPKRGTQNMMNPDV